MKRKIIVGTVIALLCAAGVFAFAGCDGRATKYEVEYRAGSGGRIDGNALQTVREGDSAQPVTAVPNEGYRFVRWSDDVTTPERIDANVRQNIKVTAVFEARVYTYDVIYLTNGNGVIRGIMQQNVERGTDAAMVTAIPNAGYTFVKWSDGVITATRTDTAVTANINVTAIFAEKTYFTVRYTAGERGRIEGEAEQTVAQGEDARLVTAVPDYRYQFVRWSDGNTDRQRKDCNVLEDIAVTAIFAERRHTVTYKTEGHGHIEGEAEQSVLYDTSAATVTAVPDEGYRFVRWSDWLREPERKDTDITADLTVTAIFEPIPYTVTKISVYPDGKTNRLTYTVPYGETLTLKETENSVLGYSFLYWDDGVEEATREEVITRDCEFTAYFGYIATYSVDGAGGTLTGPLTQKFTYGTAGETVTAVPQSGYVFGGWSDLRATPARADAGLTRHTEYVAYFEPVQKTFTYNYGPLFTSPLATQITLTRNTMPTAAFAVPELPGYTFGGWYADADYKVKAADENGRPFLGYYTFLCETDVLYAKWQKTGEEKLTYKILMVMTDELHASLYSSRADRTVDADYKMTAIERKILALIPPQMAEVLNEWFEGRVTFEIDTYFTLQPIGTAEQRVGKEMMNAGVNYYGETGYDLFADKMPEMQDFLPIYHALMVTYCFGDYERLLVDGAGGANSKYAGINMESMWPYFYKATKGLHALWEKVLLYDKEAFWHSIMSTYFHEFVHTVEQRYDYRDIYAYHKVALDPYNGPFKENTRLYLLHQYIADGEHVGIPPSYWENPENWNVENFPRISDVMYTKEVMRMG